MMAVFVTGKLFATQLCFSMEK